MKKQIKNLTELEALKICNKHVICFGCPLNHTTKCIVYEKSNEERVVKVDD